jgi:N-acetylneuraminic acid mutarotase
MITNADVGRRAYLVGGYDWLDIDIYNPVTRAWSKGAKPPLILNHMQCVGAQGKLWIMAAWSVDSSKNLDFAYMYDPAIDTWFNKTALPVGRRRGSASVVASADETKIYVSHGTTGGHRGVAYPGHNPTLLPYLDVYYIANDTWAALSDTAPNPRDHAAAALIGNKICVAAGRQGNVTDWPLVAPTDCYNLDTKAWEVHPAIPQLRARAASARTCDGHLIVAGGDYGPVGVYNNVDVFNGTHWRTIAPLLYPRHLGAMAVDCVCNRIHIVTGSKVAGYGMESPSMETYFPSGSDTPCLA